MATCIHRKKGVNLHLGNLNSSNPTFGESDNVMIEYNSEWPINKFLEQYDQYLIDWRGINWVYQNNLNKNDIEPSFSRFSAFDIREWDVKNFEKDHAGWINHWRANDAFEWESKHVKKNPAGMNFDQRHYVQSFTSNANNGVLAEILQKLNKNIERNYHSCHSTNCRSCVTKNTSETISTTRNLSQRAHIRKKTWKFLARHLQNLNQDHSQA